MISKIGSRFTYTNVALTLGLVFLMTGGAYAAKRYLITSTKQISPKVLTSLKGKQGVGGPQGAAGAPGPQGAKGDAGAQGIQGKEGAVGKDGKEGVEGKEGSPWTAGGTLPSGKSEYGQWSGLGSAPEGFELAAFTGVSFTIPLIEPPLTDEGGTAARYIGLEEGEHEAKQSSFITNNECGGTAAEPSASAGHLCVFAASSTNVALVQIIDPSSTTPVLGTIGKTGAIIRLVSKEGGSVSAWGTWAVTAE